MEKKRADNLSRIHKTCITELNVWFILSMSQMTYENFITSYPEKHFHPNKYHSISSVEHLQPQNIKFSCRELMSNTKITFSRHSDWVSNVFKLFFLFCIAAGQQLSFPWIFWRRTDGQGCDGAARHASYFGEK